MRGLLKYVTVNSTYTNRMLAGFTVALWGLRLWAPQAVQREQVQGRVSAQGRAVQVDGHGGDRADPE